MSVKVRTSALVGLELVGVAALLGIPAIALLLGVPTSTVPTVLLLPIPLLLSRRRAQAPAHIFLVIA